ncbi:MAG TPA: chemotaxis protein CheB, partial [Candidatus Polarisedimenticolaceae bacterium]|nr:chemotaxis protein CheB [Candidatus Polarisedimenticolaceae bacterium]
MLAALPRDPGMAVVLVQHLDPKQHSMLPEILAKTTKMPVHEAEDGTRWEQNHVYVMPASAQIKLVDGVLRLTPRPPGLNHPVDEFFHSLATEPSVRAIGIVLSGSGTDGTKGLRAIKSSGGLTFAQDSASAKFDGMPRNAVQSGCVDLVLPPEEIAGELIEIGRHPYWFRLHSPPASEEAANALDGVLAVLRKVTGVDFSFYKRSTLERRILRRVVLHRMEGVEPYLELVSRDRDEVHALFNDVLIHVTSFFREPSLNEALRTVVFPRLLEHRPADRPVRIWVPGCSTGEEAYSLAILLDEYLQEQRSEVPVQIFATDLSDIAIDRARAGIYPESISADVSPERLHRDFEKGDHRFQVRRRIRERCVFARQDITKDPPFSHLDLISCCNVLIYLGPVLQKRVIPLFHYALKREGILVLGPSESTGPFADLFEPLDRKHRLYLRRAASVHAVLPLMGRTERGHLGGKPEGQAAVPDRAVLDLHREADRLLLTHYAPAGVLVDETLEILHFRGRTEPFLEPPSGDARFHLMGMVRKGLWEQVHLAVQQAREERAPVTREGLQVRIGGESREVRLRVLPVSVPPDPPRGLLVLFETVGVDVVRSEEASISPEDRGDELKRLNQELLATRHQLQSAIENHQTATEEILSANEELQSTNEEMETAKEELQSANEELMTLNDELRTRNLELSVAYSDLNNVLSSANIPFLILGKDLKIRRVTPM